MAKINKKIIHDILSGKAEYTADAAMFMMISGGLYNNEDGYKKFINECTDDNLLINLFQAYSVRYKRLLTRGSNYYDQESFKRIVSSYVSKRMIDVADESGLFDAVIIDNIRNAMGFSIKSPYDCVMRKMCNELPISYYEIKSLSSRDVNKIFENYKSVRHKTKLYTLACSKYFNEEKHLPIAMNYIGFNSFRSIVGINRNNKIPFKLSYIKQIKGLNKHDKMIEFISIVLSKLPHYHQNIHPIKLIVDVSKEELDIMLFPILIKDEQRYKRIMANLGFICSRCFGTNSVRMLCPDCHGYKPQSCKRCNGGGYIYEPCSECNGENKNGKI